jgi:FixJ family two-component response regulator
VVEDDESVCRSLARLLQAAGYQPVSYLSAEAFLNDANRPIFDCLTVDIQLGGISGIELHELLANAGSTTPVIFLTAQDLPEEVERSLRTRCAAFMRKSDPGDSVLAAIDKAIHMGNKT